MLPAQVTYADLVRADIPGQRGSGGVPVGVAEAGLAPVRWDFAAEPHFLVFGEHESGKSNMLRLLVHGVAEAAERGELKAHFFVVDYRRGLIGAVPANYEGGYAATAAAATELLRDVATALQARIPGPEVTPEQLRTRSWWSGSEVFVLVDDYDVVASATGNPLAPLVEVLPYARDVGLHLIVARQSGGAGRASFDPVVQRLRELNAAGLLLSGDREEGPLLAGVRASRQPVGRGQFIGRRVGSVLVQTAWVGDESVPAAD